MKKINNYTTILLIAIMCISLASCSDLFKVEDNSFKGSQVGFAAQSGTVNLGSEQSETVSLTVQLIAEQRGQDLTFNVSSVDSLSDAQEGTDYTLPSTTVTIPADSSAANYTVNVSGENLTVDETRTLALRVEGTDNVESAEILGLFTLSLVGTE